jgi:predicted O-methyltransferase YrrM
MAQLQSFEMDGVRFVLDIRAGKDRGKSKDGEFVLVKTNAFLQFYRELQQRQPKNILEVGILEGGSLVLFDKLYKPEKLVGVDIRREPIEPLERYRENRAHVRPLYDTSQNDQSLPATLSGEFPDGIDLIVDDASHQYELSRATFHLCFPLLKPGGLYVIEDWSWSHKPPHQAPTHPWFEKPALTNLIMELVINMPDSQQMNRVTVHHNLVVVEKAGTATGPIDLADGRSRLRARELGQL